MIIFSIRVVRDYSFAYCKRGSSIAKVQEKVFDINHMFVHSHNIANQISNSIY